MGTLVDSSVLIRLERSGSLLTLQDDEEVAIAAITASELLHGVHRADPQRRAQREAFVEQVLQVLPVHPFSLETARVHARLWADLAATARVLLERCYTGEWPVDDRSTAGSHSSRVRGVR